MSLILYYAYLFVLLIITGLCVIANRIEWYSSASVAVTSDEIQPLKT